MKLLPLALLALSLSASLNAFTAEKDKEKMSKDAKKLFLCTRKAADTHRLDKQDILTLEKFLKTAANDVNLEGQLEKCQEFVTSLEKKAERPLEKIIADVNAMNSANTISWNSADAIKGMFNNDSMFCTTYGVMIEAGLGLAGGVGAETGRCLTNNGRVYIVTGFNGELGLGAYAGVVMNKKTAWEPTEGVANNEDVVSGGIILVGRSSLRRSEQDGFGIGAGVAWYPIQRTVYLKILKRGNNFSKVQEMLLK